MRTKVEILSSADEAVVDIRKRSMLEAYYMRLELEVQIDIRDIFYDGFLETNKNFHKILDKL